MPRISVTSFVDTTLRICALPLVFWLARLWARVWSRLPFGTYSTVMVIGTSLSFLGQLCSPWYKCWRRALHWPWQIERLTGQSANYNWSSISVSRLTVDEKWRQHFSNNCNVFVASHFTNPGYENSHKSRGIYEQVESKHAFITAISCKIAIMVSVIAYLASALLPVSHAIFGYPPPELWALPLESQ